MQKKIFILEINANSESTGIVTVGFSKDPADMQILVKELIKFIHSHGYEADYQDSEVLRLATALCFVTDAVRELDPILKTATEYAWNEQGACKKEKLSEWIKK